ncbi:hypothetical protein B0H13DRAFT_1480995, partial [Mycena leptocephala]
AVWTVPDEAALIEYLIEHLSEAGDGKSFKTSTFNGAAKSIHKCVPTILLLIRVIKGISGWKWNAEKGVDVDAAMVSSWDDWVAKNPQAKRFCNKGWPHYERLLLLMLETFKGINV